MLHGVCCASRYKRGTRHQVMTNESATVPNATSAIASAIQSGNFLKSLRTSVQPSRTRGIGTSAQCLYLLPVLGRSGGAFTRRAAALSIAPYTAADKVGTLSPSKPPVAASQTGTNITTAMRFAIAVAVHVAA